MKMILSTLLLTFAIAPAFASQGGFGVGGPDSYIWAELGARPICVADRPCASPEARAERNILERTGRSAAMGHRKEAPIANGGRMNPDLAPGSSFYGGFL